MCRAIEELCKNASAKAFEKGIEEGRATKSIELARDLLQIEKMPPEKVAHLVGLPLEKVLSLC